MLASRIAFAGGISSVFKVVVFAAIVLVGGSPLAHSVGNGGPPIPVRVCSASKGGETSSYIYMDLLRLALEEAGVRYDLGINPANMAQPRRVVEMRRSKDQCTVTWMGTSPDYERDLLPVRVPLFRGYLGFRVSYIRSERQVDFDKIETVSDLGKFKALVGSDWVDIGIMEAGGLPVIAGTYESLSKMLVAGWGDYYPRGIFEIDLNPSERRDTVVVERHVLLYYPLPMYFFVGPDNYELRDALQYGLDKAMSNGSYDALFANHPQTRDVFSSLRLTERRLLQIGNPIETSETHEALAKYYIDPTEFLRRIEAARRP